MKKVCFVLISLFLILGLIGCGEKSLDEIIIDNQNAIEYGDKCYYSDGSDILMYDGGTSTKIVDGGKYIFFIHDDYIYYSIKLDYNGFDKSLYRIKIDGSDKQLILEHLVDAQLFEDRIYYSSLIDVSKYGKDLNWDKLRSIDLAGNDMKEVLGLKSLRFFYIYDDGGNVHIYADVNDAICKYSLDGEFVNSVEFEHIFGVVGLNDKIYLSDDRNIYKIDLSSFTEKKIYAMTSDNMKVYGSTLYAELYNNNTDYTNKKWYKLNEKEEFLEIVQ